jgi:hypothetical protein
MAKVGKRQTRSSPAGVFRHGISPAFDRGWASPSGQLAGGVPASGERTMFGPDRLRDFEAELRCDIGDKVERTGLDEPVVLKLGDRLANLCPYLVEDLAQSE